MVLFLRPEVGEEYVFMSNIFPQKAEILPQVQVEYNNFTNTDPQIHLNYSEVDFLNLDFNNS